MAYTKIDDPTAYFQAKKYVGTGSSQAYTFDGNSDLQANFLWFKSTDLTQEHWLADSVRGTTKYLESNSSNAEATSASGLSSFDSNGFTFGSDIDRINGDGHNYVGWGWKAGTSFTNDASSTGIGTIDSAGSVNDTAGFSIISYTGTGSAATVAHGLNSKLSMYIVKNRTDNGEDWIVYHGANTSSPETDYLQLNSTAATGDSSGVWNDTAPTSSVFSVGTAGSTNGSSKNMIAYCFAEKQGYSKFESYTGNANADGTFIYTGFSPAYVMLKRTDTAGERWNIKDNKRDGYNQTDPVLTADSSGVEYDDAQMDLLSNGFKIRTSAVSTNASGGTYIYMAFAENPFVASNFNAATAR